MLPTSAGSMTSSVYSSAYAAPTILSPHQQCAVQHSGTLDRNMASDFINEISPPFANQPSLGQLLTCIPHFLFSAVPRYLGGTIQCGYDRHAQSVAGQFCFWTGAAFKGLGNICGATLGIVRGTVDTGMAWIKNLAEFAIRTALAGLSLAIDPAAARAELGFHDGFDDTDGSQRHRLFSFAASMLLPGFVKNATQTRLPSQEAGRLHDLYNLTQISSPAQRMTGEQYFAKTGFTEHPALVTQAAGKISYGSRTAGTAYTPAHKDQIPGSILARRTGQLRNTGEILNLHIDTDNWGATVLVGDGWSSLHVGVFTSEDGKIVLVFPGSETCGNIKTIVTENLGIVDSAFQDAHKLVAAFVDKYPGKVELVGFSMGGGLAQYAGIGNGNEKMGGALTPFASSTNGVEKITVFNSMGLHVSLRNELGSKIASAAVTHVNSDDDELSQWIEHISPSAQVVGGQGHRYVLAGGFGHSELGKAFANNSHSKTEEPKRDSAHPKRKATTRRFTHKHIK